MLREPSQQIASPSGQPGGEIEQGGPTALMQSKSKLGLVEIRTTKNRKIEHGQNLVKKEPGRWRFGEKAEEGLR